MGCGGGVRRARVCLVFIYARLDSFRVVGFWGWEGWIHVMTFACSTHTGEVSASSCGNGCYWGLFGYEVRG